VLVTVLVTVTVTVTVLVLVPVLVTLTVLVPVLITVTVLVPAPGVVNGADRCRDRWKIARNAVFLKNSLQKYHKTTCAGRCRSVLVCAGPVPVGAGIPRCRPVPTGAGAGMVPGWPVPVFPGAGSRCR
jgi:hypothetical protein